jgi:hypothetical protein
VKEKKWGLGRPYLSVPEKTYAPEKLLALCEAKMDIDQWEFVPLIICPINAMAVLRTPEKVRLASKTNRMPCNFFRPNIGVLQY